MPALQEPLLGPAPYGVRGRSRPQEGARQVGPEAYWTRVVEGSTFVLMIVQNAMGVIERSALSSRRMLEIGRLHSQDFSPIQRRTKRYSADRTIRFHSMPNERRTQRIRDPVHDLIVFEEKDDLAQTAWELL